MALTRSQQRLVYQYEQILRNGPGIIAKHEQALLQNQRNLDRAEQVLSFYRGKKLGFLDFSAKNAVKKAKEAKRLAKGFMSQNKRKIKSIRQRMAKAQRELARLRR